MYTTNYLPNQTLYKYNKNELGIFKHLNYIY